MPTDLPALTTSALSASELLATLDDEHVSAALTAAQIADLLVLAGGTDALAHAALFETSKHLLVVDGPSNIA